MNRNCLTFASGVTFLPVVAILNIAKPTSSPYYNRPDSVVPAMKFNRRTYKNLRELFSDLWFPIKNRKQLREVKNKGLLSPPFQERLMLAVTSVEGCRYCSYLHSKLALKGGVSQEEIVKLLSGEVEDCPEDEALAVLYAQHWAESNACPEQEAVDRLIETYGAEKVEAIHLMLRMIRLGNLLGNTWDYLLYRISFGKWQR